MERLTFLEVGAAGAGYYETASHLPAPDDIGAIVTRLRRQSLESFDAAYVGNVILW